MSLDDVVNVSIVIQSSALDLPGFATVMIPVVHSNFEERLRYYSSLDGMLDDGFLTSDAVYREAEVIFSQNPRPSRIAIGRRATAVASVDRIRVTGTTDGDYTVTVDGQTATFEASSNTATQIKDGLVTAINNIVPRLGYSDFTAASASANELTMTAATAGIPLDISISGPTSADIKFVQNVLIGGNTAGLYTINIGTYSHPYLANGTVTAANIVTELVSLIDGGDSGVDAADGTGDSVDLLSATRFTATATSTGSSVTLSGRTANVGLPEDLAAITDEQSDWYCLVITERDPVSILTAAAAIESQRRVFVAQSNDAAILAFPYDSGVPYSDIFSLLKASGYARTLPVYSSDDTNPIASAWAGNMLPKVPGSATWKFKGLRGAVVDTFTGTELSNLRSKGGNGYRELAGRNMTFEGTVSMGEFFDVIIGVDKLYQQIQANVFGAMMKNEKIPYTNGGISIIVAAVQAAIQASVADGLIATSRPNPITLEEETPAYTIRAPNVAQISDSDRATRIIPITNPIRWEATLAGAVHAVSVSGTLAA